MINYYLNYQKKYYRNVVVWTKFSITHASKIVGIATSWFTILIYLTWTAHVNTCRHASSDLNKAWTQQHSSHFEFISVMSIILASGVSG